jgi:hypothetical protein
LQTASVAFDGKGNAVTVWEVYNGVTFVVEGSYRPVGGAWRAPVYLSPEEIPGTAHPQVAFDKQGSAIAVWNRGGPAGGSVQAALMPAGGVWQAPVEIAELGDEAYGEIGDEASTTFFYAGVPPERRTRLGFARAVDRLSWSNRRLTRLVRALAVEEVAVVGVVLPDVCADIAAWKASAYAALPPSATGFLARVGAIESGSLVGPSEESREAAIRRLLVPYEALGVRRAAKRLEQREQRTDRMLGEAAEAARTMLAAALGVSGL